MSEMNIPRSSYPRIIIIGGGFAGISLAKELSKKEVQVLLLDKNNYHTFQPLLYQVSTGGLEPDSIAYPLRKILQEYPNFYFRMANVQEIDASTKILIINIGAINYDYLVLATGSVTNFFGNTEIKKTEWS
jgi:NADH dehydrogenase